MGLRRGGSSNLPQRKALWGLAELRGQNEGYKSKIYVQAVRPEWGDTRLGEEARNDWVQGLGD